MRHEHGSSLGEQIIMLALAALFVAVVAAAFSYSTVSGFLLLGIAAGTVVAVLVWGILRDRRLERERKERSQKQVRASRS